jgi:activator of HSP90 ATPase
MKQYEVCFQYADALSNWSWRDQSCSVFAKDEYEARRKCMELYGLGVDCEYKITSVKEI